MKLPFKVTNESLGSHDEHPGLQEIIEDLYYKIPVSKGRMVKKIKDLIEQYPDEPILKNYLCTAYQIKGEMDKFEEVAFQTVKEHPDYLFGKIQLATVYIYEKKFDLVSGLFGDSFNLKDLYPDRDLFHISEVKSFYCMAIKYFLGIQRTEIAWEKYGILNQVAPDSEEDKHCQSLLMAEMIDRLKESPILKRENSKIPKYKSPDYDKNSIGKEPVFTHPEIWELYENDIFIDHDIIKTILSLPRESLVLDLKRVVRDSILRFDYFYQNEGLNIEFPLHALLLLAELNASEGITDILEMLRQDNKYIDLYFGDMLSDFSHEILLKLSNNSLSSFSAIMKEPNLLTYCKAQIPTSIAQIAIYQPRQREEVISWFSEIFDFFIQNRKNKDLLDTDLLGLMICDVFDFCGKELLPQIKEMFNLKIINPSICGTLKNVEKDLTSVTKFDKKEIHQDIFSCYEFLIDKWYTKPNEEYFEDEEKNEKNDFDDYEEIEEGLPIINPNKNIGRNDPCPCGSGKKYKKCCLKN